MIILPLHRTVIITPPKTGARTLCALFARAPEAILFEDDVRMHSTVVPEEYADYRRLMSVRNPFDRLVSLWMHKVLIHAHRGAGMVSFSEFAWNLFDGGERTRWFADHLTAYDVPKSTEQVHMERMESDLRLYGLYPGTQLPHVGRTWRLDWESYYDRSTLAAAVKHYADDLDAYGYRGGVA